MRTGSKTGRSGRCTRLSVKTAAADARRELERLARPAGKFDASRYFRGAEDLGFHNVGARAVRELARSLHAAHRRAWSIDDAVGFAEALIVDRHLEVKSLGIELLARYRREVTPSLLSVWKRWLAQNHAANWATTDAMSGSLIGPLLVGHPELAVRMRVWARDRNMWVRRAAAVSLIPSVRLGRDLDLAYEIARKLHRDNHDLIQKAVGWLLREAGNVDQARLVGYLRADGPSIPRITLRYAIERLPNDMRVAVLEQTRPPRSSHRRGEALRKTATSRT